MFILTFLILFLTVSSEGMSKQIQAIIAQQQAAGVLPSLTPVPAVAAPVGVPPVGVPPVALPTGMVSPNPQIAAAQHLQLVASQQQQLLAQQLSGAAWLNQTPSVSALPPAAALTAASLTSVTNLSTLPPEAAAGVIPHAGVVGAAGPGGLDLTSPPPVLPVVKCVPSLMSLPLSNAVTSSPSINQHR